MTSCSTHGRVTVEVAPAFTSAEIDGDEAVDAVPAGVGDVGYAFARGCDAGVEIDAEVVEVGEGISHVGWEYDGLDDSVGGEVDGDEFGTRRRGREEHAGGGVDDACDVEKPETVLFVKCKTLDCNKVVRVGDGGGWCR